jgi:uncharacterized DUF497 family protein
VEFEWNPSKADANLRKHGVSFDEAATVLADRSPSQYRTPITPKRKIATSLLACLLTTAC